MSLRLVRPPEEGQATRPPQGCRPAALFLTADEARHLRAAIKNAARAYGGMDVLASVIGVPTATLRRFTGDKGRHPPGVLAIRVAKAAGMRVEAVLGPALNEAGRCSSCGSRIGAGRRDVS
jgi:hypothetical protein